MNLNKNEKGLTLIELLITIAVIAIVAAISIPVITNVIDSARTSSAGSMEAQVNAFVEKYAASGEVTFDGIDTFTGWVDLNANGQVDENEAIETFKVDTAQFNIATNLSNNKSDPEVDDSYTDEENFPGLPSEISITAGEAEGGAADGQAQQGSAVTYAPGDAYTNGVIMLGKPSEANLDPFVALSGVTAADMGTEMFGIVMSRSSWEVTMVNNKFGSDTPVTSTPTTFYIEQDTLSTGTSSWDTFVNANGGFDYWHESAVPTSVVIDDAAGTMVITVF